MIVTETTAYMEMCTAARAAIASTAMQTLVGYAPELRYVDVTYKAEAPKDKVWCRISLIQGGEKRRTLSQPSRKTMQGIVDVQLFIPATIKNAAEMGRKVADLLKGMYVQSTASVDFYGASIKDMPKEDAWYYKRVNATYNYDTYE